MNAPRAVLLTLLLLAVSPAGASPRTFKRAPGRCLTVDVQHPDAKGMQYLVYAPAVQPGRTYPLLFALHGNGHPATSMLAWMQGCCSEDCPVFIVAPQYQKGTSFDNPCWEKDLLFGDVFPAILKEIEEKFPIDPSRLYLAGFSMGGGMACQWAYTAHPQGRFPFRALFLYSTCMPPQAAAQAPDVPYLLFVGDRETNVMGLVNVVAMVRETFNRMFPMRKDVRYHEIPGMDHTVGTGCLEITRDFLRADAPWLAQTGKKEVQASLKEAERLGKEPPSLANLERLEMLEPLLAVQDRGMAEAAKKVSAILERLGKDKRLSAEVEARRLFREAWDREVGDPAAGKAAFQALAAAHPGTAFGMRAKARLHALEPAS